MASSSLVLLKSPLKKTLTEVTDGVLDIFINNQDESTDESPERCPDGHMPITVNERVGPNKQFKILQELGTGHFSKVWLCKNNTENKTYALKIVKSKEQFQCMALNEVAMLRQVNNENVEEIGYNRIILFYDYFIESSLNGDHVCMMFEVMGPSLYDLLKQNNFHGFKQTVVKKVIKQILEGLKFLHEKCEIIHSDLKLDNILMVANKTSSADLWKQGNLLTQTSNKTLPKRGVKKRSRKKSQDTIDYDVHIKIADLGNARYHKDGQSGRIQALSYRALEVIIEANYSFPVDIWSVGCIAFEFSTGLHLFYLKSGKDCPVENYHLGLIWRICNGIPKHIALNGRRSKEFFDEKTGALKKIKKEALMYWNMTTCLLDNINMKFSDAVLLEDFVLKLINPDPDVRITASKALEVGWFRH